MMLLFLRPPKLDEEVAYASTRFNLHSMLQVRSAPGLEELANLLTRSSRSKFNQWFGISSIQFSSLVTSFSGKFVQFMGTKFLRSVKFSSGLVQSIEPPIVWEKQRNSFRSPQRKSQSTGPGCVSWVGGWVGMVRFAGCACLFVRNVAWCQSDANSVQNR